MKSTIKRRGSDNSINISQTVRSTALEIGKSGYAVNTKEVIFALKSQGVKVIPKMVREKNGRFIFVDSNTIGQNQIKRAMSEWFKSRGHGWYIL